MRPSARRVELRGPEQQARRERQRERLLAAATEVFARGFQQASVAAIVKRAAMSRRTFYEHFKDLTDALVQLYQSSANLLFQAVESAYRTEPDVERQLESGIRMYLCAVNQYADLARIVYREIAVAGVGQDLHDAMRARFCGLLRDWAAQANAAGLPVKPPDEITLFVLVTGIEATVLRFIERGEEAKLVDQTRAIEALVLKALA